MSRNNPTPTEAMPTSDKIVEQCALALFETDTNWAHNPPSEQEVLNLWNGQMQSVREQFRKRAFAVLSKAFELGFPNTQCPSDIRF